jgi:DNA-binding CsgD family transcriptional regulator
VCAGGGGTLTTREQEVLRELAEGSSNREIAQRLWLSPDTVKSHLRRIFRKLDVGSRTEAVALYLAEMRAAP